MRQCIFVVATRADVVRVAPMLELAAKSGLRHAVWLMDWFGESLIDAIAEVELKTELIQSQYSRKRSSIGKWIATPKALYDYFQYVSSVKIWTGRRPLIVVQSGSPTTWMGSVAGRWGGGDIVYLDSNADFDKPSNPCSRMARNLMLRKCRYAICKNEKMTERLQKNQGCIVASADHGVQMPDATINALLRWAGTQEQGVESAI